MHSELAVLLEILEAQRACQASLVELSEKKIKAITDGNTEALTDCVNAETNILSEIKIIEKRQSKCVERLAALLGIPVESVCMSLIIEKAEGKQKAELERLRKELTELVEKQIKYNELNMKLLQMNMDYIQFLINTSSNQQIAPTYGNGGSMHNSTGSPKRLLDRKV
jgi:flagellar biosynthesis/type III secretory pathway chaperone